MDCLPGNIPLRPVVFVSMPISSLLTYCKDWYWDDHGVLSCGVCGSDRDYKTEEQICSFDEVTKVATEAFDKLWAQGKVPVILPALSMVMFDHLSYEDWMVAMCNVLARCDEVHRLPGASKGADREVELALRLGLVVSYA